MLKRLLSITVVGLCLAYLAWGIDGEALLTSFSALSLAPLAAAQTVILLSCGLLAYRLHRFAPQKAAFTVSLQATFIGIAVNNLLVARLGEGAKVIAIRNGRKATFQEALGLVFWERFADLNMVYCLGLAVTHQMGFDATTRTLLSAILALWAILLAIDIFPNRLDQVLNNIPFEKVRCFVKGLAEEVVAGFQAKKIMQLAWNTILIWSASIGAYYLALNSAAGLDLSLDQILVVLIAGILGSMFTVTPAGVGVYESFMVGALVFFETPKEEALVIAVTLHAAEVILPSLIGMLTLSRSIGSFKPFIENIRKRFKEKSP